MFFGSLDFRDASEKGVFDIFYDTQLKMSIPNSQQSWWVFTKFMHLILIWPYGYFSNIALSRLLYHIVDAWFLITGTKDILVLH